MCDVSAIDSMDYDSWDSYDREDRNGLSNTEARVDAVGGMTIHQSNLIAAGAPMGAGRHLRGEVFVEWGGKDGPKYGGGVSGGASDDRGNFVEGSVQRNHDGKGNVSVSLGHDSEKAKPKDQKPKNPKI